MEYPTHIRRHIEALQEFVRLNNIPGIVVPARGEAQAVRPLNQPGTVSEAIKDSLASWHRINPDLFLLKRRVSDGGTVIGKIDRVSFSLYLWTASRTDACKQTGKSRSYYAAQRAVRKALRVLSSEQS